MGIPLRELQHCNAATASAKSQTCLSFAERQQCRQRQQCNKIKNFLQSIREPQSRMFTFAVSN